NAGFDRILSLHISHRTSRIFYLVRHIRTAFSSLSYRPVGRRADSELLAKFGTGLRKELRENVVGAFPRRPVDDLDRQVRQSLTGVEPRNLAVIPALHLSQKNLRQKFS